MAAHWALAVLRKGGVGSSCSGRSSTHLSLDGYKVHDNLTISGGEELEKEVGDLLHNIPLTDSVGFLAPDHDDHDGHDEHDGHGEHDDHDDEGG